VKRLCLVGMAMAGLLTASIPAVATAKMSAPGHKKPAKHQSAPKPVTTRVLCKLKIATQIPADDVTVTPGQTGVQYGTAGCGKLRGVESDTFTLDDAGDMVAPFTLWFAGGTLAGKFTLTPSAQGAPTSTGFSAESYVGTAKITGGSGAWAKSTGKATLKCSTPDGAHFSCTESLKVTTPPAKVVKGNHA
jgi:hypothetical protein